MGDASDSRLRSQSLEAFVLGLRGVFDLADDLALDATFLLPSLNGAPDSSQLSEACSRCFQLWPCVHVVAPFTIAVLHRTLQQSFQEYLDYSYQGLLMHSRVQQPAPTLRIDVFMDHVFGCVTELFASNQLAFHDPPVVLSFAEF